MYELGPTYAGLLMRSYLFLPLALATVAGLCLLIASLRKSLSGGSALALGGLAGLVVVGALVLDAQNFSVRHHDAAVAAQPSAPVSADGAEVEGAETEGAEGDAATPALVKTASTRSIVRVSDTEAQIATIGYALLPMFLAAVSALALLILTLRKGLDGGAALALGGLCGIVVLGSVFSMRSPEGTPMNPLLAGVWSGDAATEEVEVEAPTYLTIEQARAHFEAQAAALDDATKALGAAREDLAGLKATLAAAQQSNTQLADQVKGLAADLAKARSDLGDAKAARGTLDGKIEALGGKVDGVSGDARSANERVSGLSGRIDTLQSDMSRTKSELIGLMKSSLDAAASSNAAPAGTAAPAGAAPAGEAATGQPN